MPGEEIEALGMNLAHFASGVTTGSLDELSSDCVGMCIAGFTDEVDEEFQPCMLMTRQTDKRRSSAPPKLRSALQKRRSGGHVSLKYLGRMYIFEDSVGFGTFQTLFIDGDGDVMTYIALDLALFLTLFFGRSAFLRFEPTLG